MELNDIISLVANVGFPILACVYLARKNSQEEERHHVEMEELRKTLEENTKAINRLVNQIKKE